MAVKRRISRTELNNILKDLPMPVQEHCRRCKQFASFLVDRVKTEDFFLDLKLNPTFTAITINGTVSILDGAFGKCSSLELITFVSSNASLFIGRDIFDSCYALKAIVVPEGSEDAYRDNVIHDRTIVELITSQNPAEEETPAA